MRTTRAGTLATLAVLAVLTATGCAGDDAATDETVAATADADDGGDTGAVGDDAGDAGGGAADGGDDAADGDGEEAGEDADPATGGDDFPIPAPDGLLLDALADAGLDMQGQRQLLYPSDALDRIVAFYDDWTGQGGEWARSTAQGTVVWQRLDGDGFQQITVAPDEDAGAQADGPVTFVLLVSSE